MNLSAREISVSVVFASLYAVGVIFLAPVSFGIYQVRLADALLPLSMIFGLPSVIGLSLGCVIGNVYGGLGPIDVIGGTAANFIASSLAWYLARNSGITRRFLGSLLETLTVTLIVGGYLSFIFDMPLEASFLGVLIGSIIAINLVGFPIGEIIQKRLRVHTYISQKE